MYCLIAVTVTLVLLGLHAGVASAGSAESPAGFVREIWVLGGSNSFRVNSPDAKEGPFKDRWEAKQDGVLTVEVDQDLSEVASAELYLELWGGHPGVANKRFKLNGKTECKLPEVGAAKGNCTYSYPSVTLKVSELLAGKNTFAFTCDEAETFWGHFLIRAACLRLLLMPECKTLEDAKLVGNVLRVSASAVDGKPDLVALDVDGPDEVTSRIAEVEYWGHYDGYDENGDGNGSDWHGFTKDGRTVGHIGTRTAGKGLKQAWSLAMVPRRKPVSARAHVRFRGVKDIVYETAAIQVAEAQKPSPVRVFGAAELPTPFWSRAGHATGCTIPLDVDPATIEKAELHVTIWDGGAGKTKEPFTLNGTPLAVAGKGQHDLLYRVVKIEPKILRKGDNVVRVLSDTDHHGIEVLLPGPALVVRMREDHSPQRTPVTEESSR
jgi:hypothetical protein